MSHSKGLEEEILFETHFDYLFRRAASTPSQLLPEGESTIAALRKLGALMADPGTASVPLPDRDSATPAIYTYFGQFIDHDVTARTDRDGSLTEIGAGAAIHPLAPQQVVAALTNGRRPQLDLDSLYGDGPGLVAGGGSGNGQSETRTRAQDLYDGNLRLCVFRQGKRLDLPRRTDGSASIADARNDENIIVGQLHASMLSFHNAVADAQPANLDNARRYVRARQLVRWAYQHVVVEDYLPRVCDPAVVADVLANGPRYFGSAGGHSRLFMPLEFSVAGFRFGHSMIRPFYDLNANTRRDIGDLLGGGAKPENQQDGQLRPELVIDWKRFVGDSAQKARIIDPKIAAGLFEIPFEGRAGDPILAHLARSNLLRGYSLSVPTGQALARAMGIDPLTEKQLLEGESAELKALFDEAYFDLRTPLWFYLLKEAAVQTGGQTLGAVGSRIVAETLVGLIKESPNSYLSNRHDAAVTGNGIQVGPGSAGCITDLESLLQFAGVL
ncbi:MAG: heme peroxidase family protein [Myxococcales bacterium]|nr:heme peroxidase family protein [Myxococcales bacterium]